MLLLSSFGMILVVNLLITQVYIGRGFIYERITTPHIKFIAISALKIYRRICNEVYFYFPGTDVYCLVLDFDRCFLFEIYIATEWIVILMLSHTF